ncbi:MAG: hypothetical protein AB1716_13390 [Planctomycetota bacterium]
MAQNVITVWEPNDPSAYVIVENQYVRLLRAGTFKMYASDPNGMQGYGHIRSITVDPNVTGEVNLYVVKPGQTDQPGADCIGWIDLDEPNVTGNLARVYAYRYFGFEPNEPNEPNNPSLEITSATAITGAFEPATVGKDIVIKRLAAGGSIAMGSLHANLSVTDPNAVNPGPIASTARTTTR